MSFAPLRVLDLTDDLAAMAGRLLVGTGADVIRIESAARLREAPAARLHWHAGKRLVRVAPDQIDETITALLPGVDVVLESGQAGDLRTTGLRVAGPQAWAPIRTPRSRTTRPRAAGTPASAPTSTSTPHRSRICPTRTTAST